MYMDDGNEMVEKIRTEEIRRRAGVANKSEELRLARLNCLADPIREQAI